MNEELDKLEREDREFKKVQLHEALKTQIRDNGVLRDFDRTLDKDKTMTSGGPVNADDLVAFKRKLKKKQSQVKVDLEE